MPHPRPPTAYLHGHDGGPVVLVPARIAAQLDKLLSLRQLRTSVRGQDAELDSVLVALATAAAAWRTSATGSPLAPVPEAAPPCPWLSTTEAAAVLGITDRAVRLACETGRLDAEHVGGRWRVSREAAAHYQARAA
ncbi:helix-turn-helix domain-containing protein [Streptomyces albus]|uniref:helix-turn-helix domain-containing protein n=1 Tax=Streptomyces albus TaxID=1888 RepID=UPI0004C8FD29|nr:helix-turn-helix domain-containing protein [Streptomyces albus]